MSAISLLLGALNAKHAVASAERDFGPEAGIEAACLAFLAAKAVLDSLKGAKNSDAELVAKQAGYVATCRVNIRRFLGMKKSRRFAFLGRKFTLDRAGVVHVVLLRASEVSPLGRKVGAPLLSR